LESRPSQQRKPDHCCLPCEVLNPVGWQRCTRWCQPHLFADRWEFARIYRAVEDAWTVVAQPHSDEFPNPTGLFVGEAFHFRSLYQ
jgi:hypothetical protein